MVGIPLGDVAVEGTGPVKRWKKEGVRVREKKHGSNHHYNLLLYMVVTREVSQVEMSPLKVLAYANTGKRRW